MATKTLFFSRFIFFSLLFSFFFFSFSLYSQPSDFFIERQTRFIQRFSWTPDEYALRYEVEIERAEEGIFNRHFFESTEESSILVSLPPGNYRYRVTPYNLLNRPGRITEWLEFEIIQALDPILSGFSPQSFTIGRDDEYVLHIFGDNLISEDEMYLLGYDGGIIIPERIQILNEGREALLYFSSDQLAAGLYHIYVKNPGGLDTSISGLIINYENREIVDENIEIVNEVEEPDLHWSVNIYLGINWFTFINLSGENNHSDQFHSGIALRINVVSSNLSFFNIGLELAPAWYSINSLFTGEETTQSLLLEANFLLQKQFFDRTMALTFRAGAGIIQPMYIMPVGHETQDPLDNVSFYANTGLSFLWMPLKRFYIEAGVNYSFIFEIERVHDRLRPWISMGTRF